jgi:hypothetical protein
MEGKRNSRRRCRQNVWNEIRSPEYYGIVLCTYISRYPFEISNACEGSIINTRNGAKSRGMQVNVSIVER